MGEYIQVLDVADRRALERNVLKSIIDDENLRRKEVLKELLQDNFETPEFREVFSKIQLSVITSTPLDSRGKSIAEVFSEGNVLNGSWSIAVERLKVHRFDRVNYALSDLGNAERFEAQHGTTVKYDHTRKQWLLWDGKKWKVDDTGEVVELMATTLRGMYSDATSLSDEGDRKAMARWALASENRVRISDALSLAQSLPKIRAKSTDFDSHSFLVNLQNGTLDLKVGTFLPHNHRCLCSKIAGTRYDDAAKAPRWEEFLNIVFKGDPEIIGFVQRAIGYSLTGITDSQAIFFAYGSGANGKTTFFETLRILFGDYYQKAPSELLLLKRSETIPADVARLRGVRLVVLAEIEAGRRLNESKTKDLSGGDTIVARHLYGNFFEFQPTHKVWMYGNHKPIVTGTDYGIWRRLHLIPFTVTIPPDKRKPMGELLSGARRELSGILNWCIEGYEDWRHRGLAVPSVVEAATEGYRVESDAVGQFLDECCAKTGEISSGDLYAAYEKWIGSGAMSSSLFIRAIKEKGHLLRVGAYKKRYWQGLSLSVE